MIDNGSDPEKVRATFKATVEALPQDPGTWRAWAEFERETGNEEQSLVKAIRAVECQPEEVVFAVEVSGRLVKFISDNSEFLQVSSRRALVTSVREVMDGHRRSSRLNADGLSRLAWLYLVEFRPELGDTLLLQRAAEVAAEGLQLDPTNEHCLRLADRVSEIRYRTGEVRRFDNL